jgi:hypothetical protein
MSLEQTAALDRRLPSAIPAGFGRFHDETEPGRVELHAANRDQQRKKPGALLIARPALSCSTLPGVA